MLLAVNIIYPILAIIASILLMYQLKIVFILYLVINVLTFYIGWKCSQMGIASMSIFYMFTSAYSYNKWSKLERGL